LKRQEMLLESRKSRKKPRSRRDLDRLDSPKTKQKGESVNRMKKMSVRD